MTGVYSNTTVETPRGLVAYCRVVPGKDVKTFTVALQLTPDGFEGMRQLAKAASDELFEDLLGESTERLSRPDVDDWLRANSMPAAEDYPLKLPFMWFTADAKSVGRVRLTDRKGNRLHPWLAKCGAGSVVQAIVQPGLFMRSGHRSSPVFQLRGLKVHKLKRWGMPEAEPLIDQEDMSARFGVESFFYGS